MGRDLAAVSRVRHAPTTAPAAWLNTDLQIEFKRFDLKTTGFDQGEVEKIVDNLKKLLSRTFDYFRIGPLVWGELGLQ